MLDKEIIKSLYLKGYTAVQIAKKTGYKTEAVRKTIQRNFGNIKGKHKAALFQKKDAVKAVNYEANRYISDRAFILKNRTAYKTLPNGDIVLNRDVAPTTTFDTPKRLVNGNK